MIQSVKYVASIYKIAIKRAERIQCQETDDMAANFFFHLFTLSSSQDTLQMS